MKPLSRVTDFFRQAGDDLHLLKHDYFIVGSAAMILAGVELEKLGDINILTTSADANFLKMQWKGREVKGHKYAFERIFRSNSGRFKFESLDAEVMGNLEVNAGQQWVPLLVRQFMNVRVGDLQVKIPTIKEQHRIYKFFGRPKDLEKAEMLMSYF